MRGEQLFRQNLKAPIRHSPVKAGQQLSCPRRRVPAREWLTRWHWSLGCHQGLRVLLVMTGQGRACMVIVFLHTQDVLKRPVIHLTFYFGAVWFAEFRVDLAEVTQGLNSCRFGLWTKPQINEMLDCSTPHTNKGDKQGWSPLLKGNPPISLLPCWYNVVQLRICFFPLKVSERTHLNSVTQCVSRNNVLMTHGNSQTWLWINVFTGIKPINNFSRDWNILTDIVLDCN